MLVNLDPTREPIEQGFGDGGTEIRGREAGEGAEETWARLFMLTLLYAVLRAASPDRAGRALFTAVLIAA
ncbi:MAG: hypothetical protein RL885_07085, partial [Planctomycetota bacterium]